MSSVISCPQCLTKMKLKAAPTPGKKVRCPKCSNVFAPAGKKQTDDWEDNPYSQSAAPARRPKKKATKKRKAKKSSSNSGLVIAIVAGGLIMLTIGIIGAYKIFNKNGNSTFASNGNSISGDEAEEPIPTIQRGPAITDTECQSFIDAMERAVSQNNRIEFQRLMNFEGVIDKSITGIELSSKNKADFKRGLRTAIPQWTSQFMAQITTGSYQHLRTQTGPNGIRQVLFRLNSDDGLNYHRFDLVRTVSNQIVCGDFYIFTTGEYYSQTMRRILLPIIAHETRSIMERLTGTDNALVANLTELQEIQRLTQQGDYAGAMRIYKSLPEELRREKFALLIRINSASELNETEYVAAMEDFRKYHPNDVCLDLIGIDYFLLKKQYAKSLACIDRLNEAVGGDPALAMLSAPILGLQERYPEALQKLQPFTRDEVHAEEAYTLLLDIYVAQNNHEETARTLSTLTDRFGYEWDVESAPEFSAFVASAAYNDWRAGSSAVNPFAEMNQQTAQPAQSGMTQTPNSATQNNSQTPKTRPQSSTSSTRRRQNPESVVRDFKFNITAGRAENAKAKIAPIKGRQKLEALLREVIGNFRHPMHRKFSFLVTTKSHIEGNVAVALSPFFGRKNAIPESIDRVYLVLIEDEWKICPTLDKPPIEPEYASNVQAIQQWIESQ